MGAVRLHHNGHSMDITIYHNPQCGTSRNTLVLIRHTGALPTVIEYLTNPPDRATLVSMIAAAGLTVREVMRTKEAIFSELGLQDPTLGDDVLLDAMLANPVLINRPFVVAPAGVRLCRPSELVLDLLAAPHQGAFTKEDGEAVIDKYGQRVK